MSRVWHVFVREYLENVRTKAFLIGLVLTPLWFVLAFAIPRIAVRPLQRVVVLDTTGALATEVRQELERPGPGGAASFAVEIRPAEGAFTPDAEGRTPVERLRSEASQGNLIGIVLTPPLLEKRTPAGEEREAQLFGSSSVGAAEAGQQIAAAVNRVLNRRLIAAQHLPGDLAERLTSQAIRYEGLDREGKRADFAQMIAPMAFMLLLFMGIVGISQMLVSTTLEEKSNRVYEVLLSSVSPFQLMTGKLLGVCAVGFTLMTLWSGGGLLAAALQGMTRLVTGAQIGLLVAYYVLGFFLIASLMAAVGSACNTLKEAQNLMAPISLLLAFPILLSLVVLRDPNGTFATVASFIPPFTPFLMMARIGSVPGPPDWQIAASLVLLAGSTFLALRICARVFRVGILLYGQPPRLRQIWRWMWSGD